MGWPAKHVGLIAAYIRREPPADERMVYQVARLNASMENSWKKKGSEPAATVDFILFLKAWEDEAKADEDSDRYTKEDLLSLNALDNL